MNARQLWTRWSAYFLLTAIIRCVIPGLSLAGDATTNPNVNVWTHLSRQSFRAGETGELTITFAPREGYHINAAPPVSVVMQESGPLILKGPPALSVDKKTGFLSTKAPVRQAFSVSGTTPPGSHIVKGTITYSYTSDAKGWTRRVHQPVSLSFMLTE